MRLQPYVEHKYLHSNGKFFFEIVVDKNHTEKDGQTDRPQQEGKQGTTKTGNKTETVSLCIML